MKNLMKATAITTAGALLIGAVTPTLASAATIQPQERRYERHYDGDRYRGPDMRQQHRAYINRHDERRYWRNHNWRDERRFERDRSGQLVAFVAGTIIGSAITDSRGERRQYYFDPRTDRYYYYSYDRRGYYWDYGYSPYHRR